MIPLLMCQLLVALRMNMALTQSQAEKCSQQWVNSVIIMQDKKEKDYLRRLFQVMHYLCVYIIQLNIGASAATLNDEVHEGGEGEGEGEGEKDEASGPDPVKEKNSSKRVSHYQPSLPAI